MARKDRQKWDARYRSNIGETDASSLVRSHWNLAPMGKALDIACGNGRNSLFLAEKGFAVDAVDISTVAIDHLAEKNRNIDTICADLDTWTIPENRYDLVISIRFLDRRLFPMIQRGLKPEGVLIFESFIDEEKNRYCLRPNELLRSFSALRVLAYTEKKSAHGERFDTTAALVAVKEKQPFH